MASGAVFRARRITCRDFFIADRRHGTGVDHVGVGLPIKGDQGVAPLGDQLLQSLGLVLIYFAP